MNSILKYEIKSDIRDIIAEIDYEEYMFNKIFKTHVTFKNSYKKFNLIYDIYGPQAYRKFVPSSYQKQDLINLINTQNSLILYDRHGKKIFKNLAYTVNIYNFNKYYIDYYFHKCNVLSSKIYHESPYLKTLMYFVKYNLLYLLLISK